MSGITTSNLAVEIENATVLRGVSVDVERGETVALVGRNGAGKTTTFKTIMGLQEVTDGTITITGKDVTNSSPQRRANLGVGFAPEDRRLFANLTVRDNLRLANWGSREPQNDDFDDVVDQVVEVFPEVEGFLDRRARQLSGGQQQMVAVSRALASEPDFVLLDEPFEGLAPAVRERFRNGVERMRDLGLSIFIAESNVEYTELIADRAYLIERGEIQTEVREMDGFTEHEAVNRIFEGE